MSGSDTAWMLVATALVLLMPPALAFFYGGLVRSKNALNTMMMSVSTLGFVGAAWAVFGYSLAFAPGTPLLGGLSNALLRGVGLDPSPAAATIPHVHSMSFQRAFAIITTALISVAVVERKRFSAYILFIVLWSLALYAPVAHWDTLRPAERGARGAEPHHAAHQPRQVPLAAAPVWRSAGPQGPRWRPARGAGALAAGESRARGAGGCGRPRPKRQGG